MTIILSHGHVTVVYMIIGLVWCGVVVDGSC